MMQRHRKAHARIWTALAIALPLLIGVALISARDPQPEVAPVRLDGLGAGG